MKAPNLLVLLVSLGLLLHTYAERNITQTKVLVLGAGMSGIMAAKTLRDNGENNFIILEGSDRVGGRTREDDFQGRRVELGTQWIHGASQNNPIYYEATKRNITLQLSDFDDWTVRNNTGDDVTDEADEVYERFYEAVDKFDIFKEVMLEDDRPDISLRSAWRYFGWEPKSPIENLCDWYEADFESATPPEESSAKYTFSETYTDFNDNSTVVINEGGYDELHKSILQEVISENDSTEHLMLNTIVQTIEYNDGGVKVTTTSGDVYEAEYAIVTFSIGVLQHNDVTFSPELPDWKRESIHAFNMGQYVHFMMKFPYQFWDDSEFIAHPSERRDYYPLFLNWNKFRPGTNFLKAIVTGEEAIRLQYLTDEEIVQEVTAVLRNMYNNSIPDPIDIKVPRWYVDPLFRGSFINWPAGFSLNSHKAMCAPVERLFFAGEACKWQYFGFLHGAYISGVETAEEVVDCVQNGNCPDPYIPPYAAKGCMYSKAKNFNEKAQLDDGSCLISKCAHVSKARIYRCSVIFTYCAYILNIFNSRLY